MIPETDMLFEIRQQPAILERVRSQARAFWYPLSHEMRAGRSIRFVGCGDMDFSARLCAGTAVRIDGPSVHALRSMDIRWEAPFLTGEDFVVVASFSGRTPRTLEAALLAGKQGAQVIGITGNRGSMLARSLDRILVLDTGPSNELERHEYAGYHFNIPQTRTFLAVLMAELEGLAAARRLSRDAEEELGSISGMLERFLPSLESCVSCFMEKGFREIEKVAVLGSGPWRALAAYGAAKFLEMAIPARYQCIEENNHLEMFVTQKEDLIIFLAPDRASLSRARELFVPYARFGALRLAIVPPGPDSDEPGFHIDDQGTHILTLPRGGRIGGLFLAAVLLQLLPAAIGPCLGRDINQWVGGVRTPLIEAMGQECVRGSAIVADPEEGGTPPAFNG
ncbi:MAG: SIS domain-containing protein [Planctomycetota bacterium]